MSVTRSPFGSMTTTPRPASMSPRTKLVSRVDLPDPVAPMTWRCWRASGTARLIVARLPVSAVPKTLAPAELAVATAGGGATVLAPARARPGTTGSMGRVGHCGQLPYRDEVAATQSPVGQRLGRMTESPPLEPVPPGVEGEGRGQGVGPPSQSSTSIRITVAGGHAVADDHGPARLRGLGQDGSDVGAPGRIGSGRLGCLRLRDEVEQSRHAASWPSRTTPSGGPAKAAHPSAGHRTSQNLHAGGGAVVEAGEGAEERTQRVDVVVDLQRILLPLSQAQFTAGHGPERRSAVPWLRWFRCAPPAMPLRPHARPSPGAPPRASRGRSAGRQLDARSSKPI